MLVDGRDDLFIATQPGGKATQEGKLGKDRLRVQGDDQPLGAGTGSRMGKRRNLSDPMDCSPPGASVHENFQARMLEWGAISYSRGSSQPRDRTLVSCIARRVLYH